MRGPALGLAAALLATALGACVPADSAGAGDQLRAPAGSPPAAGGVQAGAPLLDLVMVQPEEVRFHGIRRVELGPEGGDAQVHREEVACDGQGRFLLEPLEVLEGSQDPELTLLLETGRSAYSFRYRDLRVGDPERFFANHLVTASPEAVTVAGRPCIRLAVRRRVASDLEWTLDLDADTGLLLAFEERAAGQRVQAVAFESIEFDAPLTGLVVDEHRFPRDLLDMSLPLEPQLGFKVLEPGLLPPGFVMRDACVIHPNPSKPEESWVRLEYGDGLSRVVLLQKPQDAAPMISGSAQGTVRVDRAGAWTFVTGSLDGHELVLGGKADEVHLLELLQSAL